VFGAGVVLVGLEVGLLGHGALAVGVLGDPGVEEGEGVLLGFGGWVFVGFVGAVLGAVDAGLGVRVEVDEDRVGGCGVLDEVFVAAFDDPGGVFAGEGVDDRAGFC